MLVAVLAGVVVALLFVPFGKMMKGGLAKLTAVLPAALFIYFCQFIPEIAAGNAVDSHTLWVPTLGINFDFRLDGLSRLFSLLITGIGTLIFL